MTRYWDNFKLDCDKERRARKRCWLQVLAIVAIFAMFIFIALPAIFAAKQERVAQANGQIIADDRGPALRQAEREALK
jgi:hypothetical protein